MKTQSGKEEEGGTTGQKGLEKPWLSIWGGRGSIKASPSPQRSP